MKRVFEANRKLWHYIEQPKLFGLNSWEKRNCGGDEEPPQQPAVKTADQLFSESIANAIKNTPLAYGARESMLGDINKGNAYYEQFQPTSFEQALGNQYFQNVMPDVERSIKQNLSLSGIESSPVLASLIGTQRGNLGVSIGEYLSNLGNQRATASLNARNIDPYSTYQNYLATDMGQSNKNNEIAYQNALNNYAYNPNSGMATGIGTLAGGTLGAVFGGPAGAALVGGIGGGIGSLFEGNKAGSTAVKAPISMGDALSAYSSFNQGKAQPVYGNTNTSGSLQDALNKLILQYGQASY